MHIRYANAEWRSADYLQLNAREAEAEVRERIGGRGRFEKAHNMMGEACEVEGPEGEGDEEPVVDVPDEVGVAGAVDLAAEGVELFQQRGAVGGGAEGEGG
jgi:hypothetical protein